MITRENTAAFLWLVIIQDLVVVLMLWTGKAYWRGMVTRAEAPRSYWIVMAIYILLALSVTSASVAFYLGARG